MGAARSDPGNTHVAMMPVVGGTPQVGTTAASHGGRARPPRQGSVSTRSQGGHPQARAGVGPMPLLPPGPEGPFRVEATATSHGERTRLPRRGSVGTRSRGRLLWAGIVRAARLA